MRNSTFTKRICDILHMHFINVEYRICNISLYRIENYCCNDFQMITMDVEDTVQVLKLVNYIDKVNGIHT